MFPSRHGSKHSKLLDVGCTLPRSIVGHASSILNFWLGVRPQPGHGFEVIVASSNMLGIREGYVHKVMPRSQYAGGRRRFVAALGRTALVFP